MFAWPYVEIPSPSFLTKFLRNKWYTLAERVKRRGETKGKRESEPPSLEKRGKIFIFEFAKDPVQRSIGKKIKYSKMRLLRTLSFCMVFGVRLLPTIKFSTCIYILLFGIQL